MLADDEMKEFYFGLKALLRERGFSELIDGLLGPDPQSLDEYREASRCLVYRLRRGLEDLKHTEAGLFKTFNEANEIHFARDLEERGRPDSERELDVAKLSRTKPLAITRQRNLAIRVLREIESNEFG